MKLAARFSGGLLALALAAGAFGQGTFQNLGFESANLVPIPGDPDRRVEFASAFPGWVGTVGGVPINEVLSNNIYGDTSGFGIVDNAWPHYFGWQDGVISGGYTALLMAGVFFGQFTPADTTLSQTSLVPVSAQSLRFRAYTLTSFNALRVFLNGQRLSLVPLETAPNYTLFGADIYSWQGQMAQLDFTLLAQRPHQINNYLFLDSIQFSPQAIPEPGAFSLFALGALFLGWRLPRRARS